MEGTNTNSQVYKHRHKSPGKDVRFHLAMRVIDAGETNINLSFARSRHHAHLRACCADLEVLMMKAILIIVDFFLLNFGLAQTSMPAFKSFRYEEDYTFLKKDSSPSLYTKSKYIPVPKDGYAFVSIGGDLRYQYFRIRNEDWGAAVNDNDGFVFSRFLVHSNLKLDSNFSAFVELQGSLANNKASGTSAVDENPLDLHQFFFDLQSTSKKILFRAGRQELSYGSQRLIAVRELPNNRQAFDAAKLIWKHGAIQSDFFYSHYVVTRKQIFDDASGKDTRLWGGYLTYNKFASLSKVDLYYLGLSKTQAVFNEGTGTELRHAIGVRIWHEDERWRYDFEGLYQFGRFSEKQIKAWTISLNTGYQFSLLPLQPEMGLKTEVISGDRHKGDGVLQTFNPYFPKGAYFGLAALIGPSNLVDVHPSLTFSLWKKRLVWSIDYDIFWRHSRNDGIYAPNVALLYPSGDSLHQFIGHQPATDFTYTPNRFLKFRMEGTWFIPGAYLKAVSPGKAILFFCFTTQLKF